LSSLYPNRKEINKIVKKNRKIISLILAFALLGKADLKNSFTLLILLLHNDLLNIKKCKKLIDKK
jgi:hypothetical protein